MDIPELAAIVFFSNFVWLPEAAAIKLHKVEILNWIFLWTFILCQNLAIGLCESIFCPKNGQKLDFKDVKAVKRMTENDVNI